jgi:hypothetical protein
LKKPVIAAAVEARNIAAAPDSPLQIDAALLTARGESAVL